MKWAFAFFITLCALAHTAQACLCVPSPVANIRKSYDKADIVLSGTVQSISPVRKGGNYDFVLTIDSLWKGSLPKKIQLSSNVRKISCGIGEINVGEQFLFYLNEKSDQKKISVTSCNRYLPFSRAQEDIVELNNIIGAK